MKSDPTLRIPFSRSTLPFLMAGALNAAPIAYEGFDYAGGVNLTTETANNGTGWTDAWAETGVAGLVTSGSAQSLAFAQTPDLITDGSTHVWSESTNGNERDFSTPIPLGSQTLYFTALVRAYGGGASTADLRFEFWSGTGATGNMRANVGITNGTLFADAATQGYQATGPNTAAGAFADDTTYLLAMKRIGTNGAIFASLIEADRDPATLAAEPSSWQVTESGLSGVTLNSLRFVTGGDGGGAGIRIDELRVATDWDSAVNGIVFPPPPNFDPLLSLDPASTDKNFTFGNVFGSTTRSVTYVNNSLSGTGTVNIDDISFLDDGGGAFTTLNVVYNAGNTGTPPLLESGDKVTIEVSTNNFLPGPFTGSLTLDTTSGGAGLNVDPDFNDSLPALNVAATYAAGEKLNAGSLLETSLFGWPTNGGAAHVTPGIAPGSQGMARVPGEGDADGVGVNGSSLYQTAVPDGFSDFEFIAYFTPVSSTSFAAYVDPDGTIGITGPDGDFTDRTFQWVLLGSDVETPDPAYGDDQAAETLINLAYMPDGVTAGGTPDFYVFDGMTWNPLGIGAIAGSVDNDTDADPTNGVGDGLLDTNVDPLDVINSYKLKVTGTGFGTGSASYDVSVTKVSGPDSFTTGSATALTVFHGLDGTTNTPTSHAFITSDLASDSNVGDGTDPGFRTPFWVDDACLVNGSLPDPSMTVLNPPTIILVDPPATTGTTSFSIRNDGEATSLEVTSIDTGFSGFTVTSANSFTLAPGAVQQIDLEWDSATSAATPLYETATLTINGSNFAAVELPLEAGVLVNYTQVLNNGDFETPGTDNVTDTNTFADWDEGNNPNAVTDVAGLIAPSATAAAIAAASSATTTMSQPVTSDPLLNFTVEFDFAVPVVARDLYFLLQSAGNPSRANIAYVPGKFIAYDQTSASFKDVLVINLNPATPYKLKTTGTGWGTDNPTLSLEVFDAAGSSLGTSATFAFYQYNPPVGGLLRLDFTNTFGGGAGLTVDEVSISGQNIDTSPPPAPTITNLVFVPGTPNTVTADINGGTVDIYRSTTLLNGSWGSPITTGLAPGTGIVIDSNANLPRAFYIGVTPGDTAP